MVVRPTNVAPAAFASCTAYVPTPPPAPPVPPQGTPATGPQDGPNGFPEGTALSEMTPTQRESYWRHHARRHEDADDEEREADVADDRERTGDRRTEDEAGEDERDHDRDADGGTRERREELEG